MKSYFGLGIDGGYFIYYNPTMLLAAIVGCWCSDIDLGMWEHLHEYFSLILLLASSITCYEIPCNANIVRQLGQESGFRGSNG